MRNPILFGVIFALFCSSALLAQDDEKVPYVPSPIEVVDRMLEFGDVKKADVVFDIGSGDGRMVIQAAKKYGARGVGIELDSRLVEIARAVVVRGLDDHTSAPCRRRVAGVVHALGVVGRELAAAQRRVAAVPRARDHHAPTALGSHQY